MNSSDCITGMHHTRRNVGRAKARILGGAGGRSDLGKLYKYDSESLLEHSKPFLNEDEVNELSQYSDLIQHQIHT